MHQFLKQKLNMMSRNVGWSHLTVEIIATLCSKNIIAVLLLSSYFIYSRMMPAGNLGTINSVRFYNLSLILGFHYIPVISQVLLLLLYYRHLN